MIGITLGFLLEGFLLTTFIIGVSLWLVLTIFSAFSSNNKLVDNAHFDNKDTQEDQVGKALLVEAKSTKFLFILIASLLFLPLSLTLNVGLRYFFLIAMGFTQSLVLLPL